MKPSTSYLTLCLTSIPRTSKSNCSKRRRASPEQLKTCFCHLIWVLTQLYPRVGSRSSRLRRGSFRASNFHRLLSPWHKTNKSLPLRRPRDVWKRCAGSPHARNVSCELHSIMLTDVPSTLRNTRSLSVKASSVAVALILKKKISTYLTFFSNAQSNICKSHPRAHLIRLPGEVR